MFQFPLFSNATPPGKTMSVSLCDRSLPLLLSPSWFISYLIFSLLPCSNIKVFVIQPPDFTTLLAIWRPRLKATTHNAQRTMIDMQRSTVICRAGGCHSFQLQTGFLGYYILGHSLAGCMQLCKGAGKQATWFECRVDCFRLLILVLRDRLDSESTCCGLLWGEDELALSSDWAKQACCRSGSGWVGFIDLFGFDSEIL